VIALLMLGFHPDPSSLSLSKGFPFLLGQEEGQRFDKLSQDGCEVEVR